MAAVVAFVLVAATVSVALLRSNHTPAVTTGPRLPLTATTVAPLTDDAVARQLTVQQQDLSPAWVSVRDQNFSPADLNPPVTCMAGVPAGRRSAGAVHDYSQNLQANGTESAHLISVVFLLATADDGAATGHRLTTPGIDTCFQSEAVSQVTSAGETGARVTAVTPIDDLGLTGYAERLTIQFTSHGVPATVTTDVFNVVRGRVNFQLLVQQCSCQPFDQGMEPGLISILIGRIMSSPFGR